MRIVAAANPTLDAVPEGDTIHYAANRIRPVLEGRVPDVLSTPTQAQRTIGHGLSVALVSPHRSSGVPLVGAVGTTQLQTSGLDLDTAYAHAERNLSQMLSSAQMALEFFEHGPAGAPTVVVRGHVLAAATLVAPGLRDRVTQLLGDDIIQSVGQIKLGVNVPSAVQKYRPM